MLLCGSIQILVHTIILGKWCVGTDTNCSIAIISCCFVPLVMSYTVCFITSRCIVITCTIGNCVGINTIEMYNKLTLLPNLM